MWITADPDMHWSLRPCKTACAPERVPDASLSLTQSGRSLQLLRGDVPAQRTSRVRMPLLTREVQRQWPSSLEKLHVVSWTVWTGPDVKIPT